MTAIDYLNKAPAAFRASCREVVLAGGADDVVRTCAELLQGSSPIKLHYKGRTCMKGAPDFG